MNISKNIKSIWYVLLAILLALAIFYGVTEYKKSHRNAASYSLSEIKQMTEEDKLKFLEAQIKELQKQSKGFSNNVGSEVKYSVYIKLAEAQLELGKNQEALDSLNAIPEDKRGNSRVQVGFVRAYKGVGDVAKAKEVSAANLLQYGEDPAVWVAHLEANSDLPNEELNALYRQAIPATKSNLDVMISYAKFSEKIGDKATAVAAWETAINGDPANEGKYREEIARLRQ